ncbi:MAG: hypothetical protein ACPGWR_04300 [Ardenticatenaceae bacterium]
MEDINPLNPLFLLAERMTNPQGCLFYQKTKRVRTSRDACSTKRVRTGMRVLPKPPEQAG